MIRAGVTAFFGQSMTGKTTLMLRELEAYGQRALIFDPQRDEKLNRFPALSSPHQVRAFFSSADSYAPNWIRTVRGELELYEWLSRSVRHWKGIVWVIDDSPGLFSRLRPLKLSASDVAIAGRHMGQGAGVELWVVAHRPINLPADVRSQVTRIRSFAQNEPRDLEYLSEKAGRAFAERVSQLRGHQFTAWPEGSQYERETVSQRRLVRGQGHAIPSHLRLA